MSRRYYSRYSSGLQNTCSIRSLKKAYIGNGVRMTGGDNTVQFENVPMKNLEIKEYSKLGFRISHVLLPKAVWVDFDQLPLTRLQINNGFIADEITFVENIVNHRMQLIRTLDTEYIDMIYKEKALDQKQDEIIPITQAIPGQIYIGAQCEEGNEMIYLGTFFVKEMKTSYDYNYYRHGNDRESKTYLHKLSPARAFFAVPSDEVTQAESNALTLKYYGSDNARWQIDWNTRNEIDKKIAEEKKQILANSVIPRFKILDFAVSSKRIKQVILTHKENKDFADTVMNKAAIIASIFSGTSIAKPAVNFQISNNWYGSGYFLSTSKETIETEIREFYKNYTNITLQNCYYEDRYNKQ